jgi:aspartate/methionine/tyrosine aminotransferase
VLLKAVKSYGFELSDSEAGLYLWATLGEDCWTTVEKMAKLGIVVVPGSFYGEFATKHVRFSLTASDSDITRAAARLENALG